MTAQIGRSAHVRASERFVCLPCSDEAMFEDILRFDDSFLARVAQMRDEDVSARFHRCPTAFHCVLEVIGDITHLRGYFVILPLTGACAAAIRRGEVTAGKQIRPSDLARLDQTTEAAYLSVVCAVGARARSALVASAIEVVRSMYENRGTRYLFARAATGPGARMLSRLTGERFAPDGIVHEIDLSRYSRITSPK